MAAAPSPLIRARLLGELLVERGAVRPADLERALELQAAMGGRLGQLLVRIGALSEDQLLEVLSGQLGLPVMGREVAPPPDPSDWGVPGSAELPPGILLTAVPLFQQDGKPLGALVFEGELDPRRRAWLPAFLELMATGLEDCVAYGRIDQLIVDAVVAISSAHAAKVETAPPRHGRHVRRVEELARQLAHAMHLGEFGHAWAALAFLLPENTP